MATDKIEVDMRTLQQVVYDGKDCNGLIIDGCGWRKPYSATIPVNITGVQSIIITRTASESNCGQMPDTPTTLTSSGTVLYGDTVTVTATPKTGYEITTQPTFKSGVTNGKVTGAVELNAPVAKRTQYKISFGSLAYGTWRINSASGYTGYVPYGSTWSIANYLSTDLRNQMVLTIKDPGGNTLLTADYERPASDTATIQLYYNTAANGLDGTLDSYLNGSLVTDSTLWTLWKYNYRFAISESSSSGTITGAKTFSATVTRESASLSYTTQGTNGASSTTGYRTLKVSGYCKDIRASDADNMIGLMEQYIYSENHSAAYYFEFDNSTLPTTLTADTTLTPVVKQYMRMKTVTLTVSPTGYGTVSSSSLSVPYGTTISASSDSVTLTVNSTSYPNAVNNKIGNATTATVQANAKSADGSYTYAFSGWTNGSGTVTANKTITAGFTRTPYRVITIENGSWGTVKYGSTPLSDGAKVPNGATLTVSITSATGYSTTVGSSTGTISGSTGGTMTVNGDETITFYRTRLSYTVSFTNPTYGAWTKASFSVPYQTTWSVSGNTITFTKPDNGGTVTNTVTATSPTARTLSFAADANSRGSWNSTSSISVYDYSYTTPTISGNTTGTITDKVTFTSSNSRSNVTFTNSLSTTPTNASTSGSHVWTIKGKTTTGADFTRTFTSTTHSAEYYYVISRSSSATQATGNITFTPTVTRNIHTYTITINNSSYGTVKNGSTTITSGTTVDYGTVLTITPTAAIGYTTTASSSTDTINSNNQLTVNGNETITFTRTGNTYTIKYHNTAGAVWQTDSRVYPATATIRTNSFTKNQETMYDYTVTYNYNNGTGSPASAQAKRIKSYLANGWKNTDGTTFQDGESFSSAMNLALQPAFTSTTSGGTVTLPNATRTGYTFVTWNDGGMEGAGAAGESYEPRSNITLTADWRANKYTLTFNANGGTASVTTRTVTYDAKYGTMPTASRTGYAFKGWYTATSGGTEITSASIVKITTDTTLYAQWTANVYTVTYSTGLSTSGTLPTSPATFTYPTDVTLGTNNMSKSNTTVSSYTVAYAQGNASNTTNLPDTQTSINTTTYTRNGWTTGSTNTNDPDYANGVSFDWSSPGTLNLYPNFTTNTSNGGVTTSNNTMSKDPESLTGFSLVYNKNEGEMGTLPDTQTATDTKTYSHTGWATSASGSRAYNKNVATGALSANVTLYPYFDSQLTRGTVTLGTNAIKKLAAPNGEYTVTYNYNGNGSANTTAAAARRTMYICNGWTTTNGSTTRVYTDGQTIQLDRTTHVYPCFKPEPAVDAVTLPNPTRTGYTCSGWYTAASGGTKVGDAGGSYKPLGNITLYAQWTPNTHWVFYRNTSGWATGGTLPSDQSRTYPNATTLATNSMTKSPTTNATYTITFNYNGGSGSPASATASNTTTYSANGWTRTEKSTTQSYADGASFGANSTENVYLYPCFTQSTSTSAVTLPTPTRSGHLFQGWSTSSTATSGTTGTYTPSGNVTLYAIWTAIPDDGQTVSIIFPALSGHTSGYQRDGAGNYIHSGYVSDTYTGYGSYTECKIDGITVGSSWVTIASTTNIRGSVTRRAQFVNGTLTVRTEFSVTTQTSAAVRMVGAAYSTTAIFSGVQQYTVTLPEAPNGTSSIMYEITRPDGTGGTIDVYPGEGVTEESAPYGTVITATVSCKTGVALKSTYGPWTITSDTTIPAPKLQFTEAPVYVNHSVTSSSITITYRNNTGVSAKVSITSLDAGGNTVINKTSSSVASGATVSITASGLASNTRYIIDASYLDDKISMAYGTKTRSDITTSSSSST